MARTVTLDGRIGEGGGQVVRIAVALAALTGTHLIINNIRGNRAGRGGAGLKAQHLSGIEYLADASSATTIGNSLKCSTLEFAPSYTSNAVRLPTEIKADSAACIMLIFQAILPYLVFAGDENGTPIKVQIHGETNVSFSMSVDFMQQVLLPALEEFGVSVTSRVLKRGWSHGRSVVGCVEFEIQPLLMGMKMKAPDWPSVQGQMTQIDVTIIVPDEMQTAMKQSVTDELGTVFPSIKTRYVTTEESGHPCRIYLLLVAHTSTGLRFGRDWLYTRKVEGKNAKQITDDVSRKVVRELDAALRTRALVDENLQDQLIVFQALADGRSSIPEYARTATDSVEKEDTADRPFGDGTTHATTARWVTATMLEDLVWFADGLFCEGVGWTARDRLY